MSGVWKASSAGEADQREAGTCLSHTASAREQRAGTPGIQYDVPSCTLQPAVGSLSLCCFSRTHGPRRLHDAELFNEWPQFFSPLY